MDQTQGAVLKTFNPELKARLPGANDVKADSKQNLVSPRCYLGQRAVIISTVSSFLCKQKRLAAFMDTYNLDVPIRHDSCSENHLWCP